MLFDVIHIGNPMFGKYHMVSDVHSQHSKLGVCKGMQLIPQSVINVRNQIRNIFPLYAKSSKTLPESVHVVMFQNGIGYTYFT